MYDYLELMDLYSWDVERVHEAIEELRHVEEVQS